MKEITYQSLLEKFQDKGFSYLDILFMIPINTIIYDPSSIFLQNTTYEEGLLKHKKRIKDMYQIEYDYLNTWIDYQKHR
jgi:hypothetical protein